MKSTRIPTATIFRRLIGNEPGRYALNALMWTAIWVMPILPAFVTKAFFDRITDDEPVGLTVATLVTLMVAYGLGRTAVMVFAMWNDQHFTFRVGSTLRSNLLSRIFELPGAQALDQSPGEAISRFREDIDETEETISWTVDMVGLLAFSGLALWIMVSIDARITTIVFAPTVAVVWVSAAARQRVRRYREAARETTGRITDVIGETFGSVQSIKVAGAERSMIAHFRALNDERRGVMVKDRVLTSVLESVFWNTINIATGLILIAAASAMSNGDFTVGEFALFVYFLGFVTDAVFVLGLFIARFQQATVSFGRMLKLLGGAGSGRLTTKTDLQLTGPIEQPDVIPPRFAPLERLEVRGLTFRHPGTDAGIEDVTLTLERGSFTVVTGRVGAGKTTLLRTILGLLPSEAGTVSWNGAVVDDPATFFVPPRSAYTPQVPRLFSMSLLENLLMGRRDPTEMVDAAISSAVMESDLDGMTEGLHTMVGPLGVRLSGGQIQRSATARMFVRRPDLLVFDDVSSALDVETERILWERLFRERSSVTSLVVSHRRPALRRADQIVVMENGRVAVSGTLDQVLDHQAFRAIWEGNGER